MKLQYLGTGAAEGIPAIFCSCENCKKARLAGGKSIRGRSQALIDDKILVDFPADSFSHGIQHKEGLLTDDTLICLNHFSHNGMDVTYEEFSEMMKPYDFLVSYDGMTIEI